MAQEQYKIGEFAKLVGLSTYTLRYYEDQGLIMP
ncbi:MerR family DNA-binding transcriptional regulator [Latilactobacillus curvatus]